MKKIKLLLMAIAMTAMPLAASAQNQQPLQTQQANVDLDAKYATGLIKKGEAAPDFTLPTLDGKKVSLSDYRGRYVVIDFWASWCPDCRRDAPDMVKLYNTFKKNGVEFLGVSFDTNKDSWQNCVNKLGIEYRQAGSLQRMKESAVAQAYHIGWIPTVYVVDPQGKVALATVMSDKVAKYFEALFPDNDE